jgi:hypothetical protein
MPRATITRRGLQGERPTPKAYASLAASAYLVKFVLWGYGLFPDEKGNYVKKKMSECTGRDILSELVGQLGFEQHQGVFLDLSNCIPCMMPSITSQFMPRTLGDRPQVRPILRNTRRCCLHRRILGAIGADSRLLACGSRSGRHATLQGPV